MVCQHLVLVTWPDIKAPAVGRLASLLQQFKENFSPSHPCRAVPQLGRGCPNSSSYSKTMCLPPPHYQPPSRLTRELFSAQGEGYHVHICVPPYGSVCITMRAWGSGVPQMEKLGYVIARNLVAKKGPYRRLTTLVAIEQFPRQCRRTDTAFDPSVELLVSRKRIR